MFVARLRKTNESEKGPRAEGNEMREREKSQMTVILFLSALSAASLR